jgi:lysozyme family protein
MAQEFPARRDVIRWAMSGAAGAALSGAAMAQGRDPLSILNDLKLPPELTALLPKKQMDLVRTVATLLEIERDADSIKLPFSPLAFNAGATVPTSEDSLYTAALPRLVTLIDRSDGVDAGIADRAGAVLADVNAMQRITPEALKPEKVLPSRSHDFAVLKNEYEKQFGAATIRPEAADFAAWNVKAALKFRPRYETVSNATGVPWHFIAAVHGLEASYNFRGHLHNGDHPLALRTHQVPAGRPKIWSPPDDWESSARDALRMMGFAGKTDWTLERTLYRLEAYNGFGYRKIGIPTPYLWSLTDQYDRGKFVADGTWNAKARSQQCGAAALLRLLADAKEISFS